jgi:hypothetical protein
MKNHCRENHWRACAGTAPFANGRVMGVGHKKPAGDDLEHAPPRNIRAQLQEYKHTSLVSFVDEAVEIHRRFIALCCYGS